MSIYCTLWEMRFPCDGCVGWVPYEVEDLGDGLAVATISDADRPVRTSFVEVFAQAVPCHLDMTGPAWDWLPPPVDEDECLFRAVVIVGSDYEKGTERCGQEYARPLLVLTGREYLESTWEGLWNRIARALCPGETFLDTPRTWELARREPGAGG